MMRSSPAVLMALMAGAARGGTIFMPRSPGIGDYHRFDRSSFLDARRRGRRRAHRNRRKAARS